MSVIIGVWSAFRNWPTAVKWIGTSGLLATVTGVVQLEVSGLSEKVMAHYGNDEKYPFGLPSYTTREIIDNPDRPFVTWLRNTCYVDARTGFWFVFIGTIIQVVAVWV